MLFFLLACHEAQDDTGKVTTEPTLGDTIQIVPNDAASGGSLPAEVVPQTSNNNLDVILHNGRYYFAFRTAPSHFASTETVLYVVSSTDQKNWTFETSFAMGTDLREPRFLSLNGTLFLYFAVLGDDPLDFEPQGSRVSIFDGATWSEPAAIFDVGFIPWRTRVVDGVAYLIGYIGGENIYDGDGELIQLHFLTTQDGLNFTGVVPEQPVVLESGGSETDWAFLPDGGLVAVVRNEAGDDQTGWGSKICRAEAGALADWTCVGDPKKYDSPLLFTHNDTVYLVGRRNVTETGAYDLGLDELSPEDQTLQYEAAYWNEPKRCALWEVDPDALTVTFVLDLPSRGDTCFPSALPIDEHTWRIYNYSSDINGPDLVWVEGQMAPTYIYTTDITF